MNYRKSTWISTRELTQLRNDIRSCPHADWRKAGIEALRGAKKGNYLINLLKPSAYPDLTALLNWLTSR